MVSRECPVAAPTPRPARRYPILGAVFLSLAWSAASEAILPPDAAVRAYQAGVDAAGRKDWQTVFRRMNEALATGHREPRQNFGTNRFSVDLYDPWYWRGVARMELGDDAGAREDLASSRDAGVIRRFPEFSDLIARLAELDRRAEASAAAAIPTATAVPTQVPPPTPAPTAAALPTPSPTPADLSGGGVERVLTLFSAGDFDGAEAALAGLRATRPGLREYDLLQSLILGTRYVLDGSTEPALLSRARRALFAWRERGGTRKAEEAVLSLITQVPAARSWNARFSFSKKAQAQPSPSGSPARTRTMARRKADGHPIPRPAAAPRLTTARPRSALPGVRPRHAHPPTT
jgi:hypothetical protein